jgi:HK97 family phage major capsid protein
MTIEQLIEQTRQKRKEVERALNDADKSAHRLLVIADADGRSLTPEETEAAERFLAAKRDARDRISKLDGELAGYQKIAEEEREIQRVYDGPRQPGASRPDDRDQVRPDRFVRASDGRDAALARDQRWRDHEIVAEHMARRAKTEESIVGYHGSLGNMIRSMSTSSGSAIVPTIWASDVIDRARNFAAVLRLVPRLSRWMPIRFRLAG